MEQPHKHLASIQDSPNATDRGEVTSDFRRDLAFATLNEEMVERLMRYGREEIFPAGTTLYALGDRNSEMFIVLDGGIDITLPSAGGNDKVFARLRKSDFSGEFSLLNVQRAVTEATTVLPSRLLRISRSELRLLMRAEGDIANIIVSAAIWRRIGILGETSTGIIVRGFSGDAELMHLQRFLVRNYYPHRIEEIARDDENAVVGDLPVVCLIGSKSNGAAADLRPRR